MSKKILITGASGLIGSRLTELLLKQGYQVNHIGRTKRGGVVSSYVWNIETGEFDAQALAGVDAIIHLAGAGVDDKRWTGARKNEILQSRLKSTQLLFQQLNSVYHSVKTVVSASAIGYYGFGLGEEVFTEESAPANDFLADVTTQWEQAVDTIKACAIRVVKIRIGIVLSEHGGALPQMSLPIRYNVGSPLGSGKQYLSWIHLDDLCHIFIKAVTDEQMTGAYNGVTDWCSNKEFTKSVANVLNKPLWLPNIPEFVLKIMLGEMADMIIKGSKVSSDKIRKAGFVLNYTTLEGALKGIYQ
jgi:hypothetical protein